MSHSHLKHSSHWILWSSNRAKQLGECRNKCVVTLGILNTGGRPNCWLYRPAGLAAEPVLVETTELVLGLLLGVAEVSAWRRAVVARGRPGVATSSTWTAGRCQEPLPPSSPVLR